MLPRTIVLIGETLGSYRIVDLVGQGGMAAVYVGEHVVVRHRVAIKVIHPRHLDNARMAQRFLNEARAVAAIRHPGIVEFYDFGRADDGRAYIVMELLNGETLAGRLAAGPIAPRRTIAFGRQMASALSAAHECGIVHRDLKPANVFLVKDPDVPAGERAKILDFGIAKHRTGHGFEAEVTGTGVVVGTPAHMSPEQCRGDEVDGRSDIYALGVLLYHMVTGRLPYDGGTTNELVSRQLYEECAPAATVARGCPVELSDVIARCMAKERGRRYATMDAVAIALADLGEAIDLGAVPTKAQPPPLPRTASTHGKGKIAVAVAVPPPAPAPATHPTHPWTRQDSKPTLTRTIVDAPSLLGRMRERSTAVLLAAIGGLMVVAAAVVALPAIRDGEIERPAAAAAPAATAPVIVTPLPEGQCATPAARARPSRVARDKERGGANAADKDRDSDRADKEREKNRKEKPEKAQKPEKAERPAKAERTSRKPARSRPAPRAKAPSPPEDPFATVATPAVY